MSKISEDEVNSLRRRLAVQTAATRVLAEKPSLAEAVPALLAEIGAELEWPVAEFWEPHSSGLLHRTVGWHAESSDARTFITAGESYTFARGTGLPGRVWETGEPQVVEDIARASNFPRAELATKCELKSALAFPVQVQGEFFGVLEFFTFHYERADSDLLATMRAVGTQLGQFVRRTQAEAARLESEHRFRIFAETASDATFTINENSTIIYVNPAVERIFGYHPSELVGASLATIIPTRMRDAHHAGIRRYRDTGTRNIPWSGVELPGLHKNGHEIPLEISFGEYVRDGLRYFTGIARDITERVAHERDRQEYADSLARLVTELEERTEEAESASLAKSQFLANMSHELRTPINAIVGYTELLQVGVAGPLTPQQREFLQRVSVSAKHLLGLITDVLDLSKIEAGHFQVTVKRAPLVDDIDAALDLVRPQAEAKAVALSVECASRPEYFGDPARVRQILVNLLSNAVKFTEDGGRITVRCGTESQDHERPVYVSVEDTGIGIAPEQLSDIFQPFVQASTGTTRTHGGTGLGLSISRQLARIMDAEITVESESGSGSTFTLWLRAG